MSDTPPPVKKLPGPPLRILLIEDNRGDALLLRETLDESSLSYELYHAERLQDGIQRAQQQGFDLVMLDLSLPDSAGAGTIARAGKAFWKTPLIVLTSLDDDQMGLKSLQFGAQDYLIKSQLTPQLLFRSVRYARERHREREMLLHASLVDDLTGLYNRRGFINVAREELSTATARKRTFLVVFADLDGLKKINDTHGHAAGDWAISKAAEILKYCLDTEDVIGRIGGDEFVALSVNTVDGAEDRIRADVEKASARANAESGRPYAVAISLGFFRPPTDQPVDLDLLLSRADKALYEVKRARKAAAAAAEAAAAAAATRSGDG